MSNSALVSCVIYSPNHSGHRNMEIDRITPHCVVGQCTVEALGELFARPSREASSNYGIGYDGRVGLYVDEENRSWCSSSGANDNRAITIECASDTYQPIAMNACVYDRLIDLCADICKRNGKNKLIWFGDKNKTLNYTPQPGEMILTVHRWFADTVCPGDWLYSRLGDLASKVTARISGVAPEPAPEKKCPYLVKIVVDDLNIRKGAGTNYDVVRCIEPGIYTIVQEKSGRGASKWGKLKSGIGWVALDWCEYLRNV